MRSLLEVASFPQYKVFIVIFDSTLNVKVSFLGRINFNRSELRSCGNSCIVDTGYRDQAFTFIVSRPTGYFRLYSILCSKLKLKVPTVNIQIKGIQHKSSQKKF